MTIKDTTIYYKCPQCGKSIGSRSNQSILLVVCIIAIFPIPFVISYYILKNCFDFKAPDYLICKKCELAYEVDWLSYKVHPLSIVKQDPHYRFRWFFRIFYFVGGLSIIGLVAVIFGAATEINWLTIMGLVLFPICFIAVVFSILYWKKANK